MIEREYRMMKRIVKTQNLLSKNLEIVCKFNDTVPLNHQFHMNARIYNADNLGYHDKAIQLIL
jgi:hypothetical protein